LNSQGLAAKIVSAMKIADTKPVTPFRVRVNRSGRRTFSREYKLEIIQECSIPGASVAANALAHRINANQVRKWVVQHRAGRLCPNTAVPIQFERRQKSYSSAHLSIFSAAGLPSQCSQRQHRL
jgi:transposase-like protein